MGGPSWPYLEADSYIGQLFKGEEQFASTDHDLLNLPATADDRQQC